MRLALLLPSALCCAAFAAPANAAMKIDRPLSVADNTIIKIQAMPYGYSGGYGQPYAYYGGYNQPYGYGWGYAQPYRGGYSQPAAPNGWAYSQPGSTAGIPGSWQPSASSHPSRDYYNGYR